MKKILYLLFRISITIVAISYIFWEMDFSQLVPILNRYDFFILTTIIIYSVSTYFYLGFRLRVISHYKITILTGTKATIICHGINNILPTKLGEVAKALFLSMKVKTSKAEAFSIVFWERFLDLNALLLIAIITIFQTKLELMVLPLSILVLGLWAFILITNYWTKSYDKVINLIPILKLKHFLNELHAHVNQRFSWKFLIKISFFTSIVWGLYCIQTILVLNWLVELHLSLNQLLIVFVISSAGMALPSTPGAFGVYEAVIVIALGLFGISKEEAFITAFVMHMIEYIPTTLFTFIIFSKSKINLSMLLPNSKKN